MLPASKHRVSPSTQILVADDNVQLGMMVDSVLRRAGYSCVIVHDGIAALTLLAQGQRFACALLDVEMPHLDGVSLTRALADTLPTLPVVLMSGRPPEYVRERLAGLPVAGLLRKPFSNPELIAHIAQAVRPADERPPQQAAPVL